MKKFSILTLLFFSLLLAGQNLLRNGEFDKKLDIECRYDAAAGVHRRQIITEDLTWNRCLKVEVLKYVKKNNYDNYYLSMRFGGDAKNNGFKVKPNTIYSFALEIKGQLNGRILAYQWNGSDYWKNMKQLKIKGDSRFKPSSGWSLYRGTFQTGPDATHASIGINLWGSSRYKNLPKIGNFLLIDKIKVTEKANLLPSSGNIGTNIKFTAPLKKTVVPGKAVSGFVEYKTGQKVKADTYVTVYPGSKDITVKVRCLEPQMNKLKCAVKGIGGRVWSDDLVEIFFGPVIKDRSLSQFVVTAGGGRWMGRGSLPVSDSDYSKWTAKVSRDKSSWTVEARIPYTLLGTAERLSAEKLIAFNVARTRTPYKEVSSLSYAKGSFHSVENYAILFPHAPEKWFSWIKNELKKSASASGASKLSASIANWHLGDVGKTLQQSEIYRKEIAASRLGSRKFVVTPISPVTDPTIPLIPSELANSPSRIKIRAAGNDFKALPLAITNLTGKAEEYRILITAVNKHGVELGHLVSSSGKTFSEENIQLLRGVRSKDSDEKINSTRFDALVPVDIASTVTVMPREATPVWAIFNTSGVAPGKYRGVIRVIPLSEPAPTGKNKIKKNPVHDLPIEFEVLPFEISKAPAIPQFLFSPAYGGKKTFNMMYEHGINTILVNTWSFGVWFNADGSIKKRETETAEASISNLKKYAAELGVAKDLRIGVAYGVYTLFRDRYAKNLKYATPQWEKAWRSYIRIIDEIRKNHGFSHDKFFIEICDEPKAADMPALIKAAKLIQEEVPGMQVMITFASWDVGLKNMEAIVPYLSHWCFWGTKYLTGQRYASLLKKLRSLKKNISFYSCDTSMRVDLHKYYLTHNWRALAYDLDMCNLYQFMTYRHQVRDWKNARNGEVALLTRRGPVSTIRLECLRIGASDIKYMKKLAAVLKSSKTADNTLRREVEHFLKAAPRKVVSMEHDLSLPAVTREKAIDYTLKLLGGSKKQIR